MVERLDRLQPRGKPSFCRSKQLLTRGRQREHCVGATCCQRGEKPPPLRFPGGVGRRTGMLGMAVEAEVVAALLAEPALAAARRAAVVANPSAVVRALRVVGDGAAVRRGALRRACRDTRHAPSCFTAARSHAQEHAGLTGARAASGSRYYYSTSTSAHMSCRLVRMCVCHCHCRRKEPGGSACRPST